MPGIRSFVHHVLFYLPFDLERIAIDSIGPVDEDMGLKYIIVIIDTFSRYVELFP